MSVTLRFESSSLIVAQMALAGRRNNRKRGSRSGASLGRSKSFQQGTDSRLLTSRTGRGNYQGNSSLYGNLPPITQCLMLDPITKGSQEYSMCDDVQRVLRGSTEDSSAGVALANYSNSLSIEELKLLKSRVQDANVEARSRVKKMGQSLNKLNKYCEALYSKKHQKLEFPKYETLDGCFLKMGSQIHQNTSELVSERFEGLTKTVAVSKGVHSSMTELQAEIRDNMLINQSLIMGKDQNVLGDTVECSHLVDENNHGLSAGEGWEKRRGKRRSISLRLLNVGTEMKRKRSYRVKAEHGLPSTSTQNLSSTISEDISTANQIMQIKGKGLKASQNSAIATSSSPSNVPHASGTLEAWEKPSNSSQIRGVDWSNHWKHRFSLTSSSPMVQLVNKKIPKPLCPKVLSSYSDDDVNKILSEGFHCQFGEADDDYDEILAAADFAVKANNLACPGIILKKLGSLFSCVRIKDMSYSYQQVGHLEELNEASLKRYGERKNFLGNPMSYIHDCEEREGILHYQHGPKDSGATGNAIFQFQDSRSRKMKVAPLYQRVLAALIVEDEDTFDNEGRNIPSRGNAARLHLPRKNCSENVSTCSAEEINVHRCVEEDRLFIELLNIGLYPESMPDLTDREDEPIDRDIAKLQQELSQQASKKARMGKMILERIRRELEQLAMDRLVEIAHKKMMATQVGVASKSGIPKVSKGIALAFMRRTLARCKIFENTGKSCFSEPPYSEVLFALLMGELSGCSRLPETPNNMKRLALLGSFRSSADHHGIQNDDMAPQVSMQSIEEARLLSSRGRNKEVLVDDNSRKASMEVASCPGKRGRTRNKSSICKNDQQSKGFRGKRKTRAKRKKPGTDQLLSSGNELISKSAEPMVPVNTSTIGPNDASPSITHKAGEVGLSSAADIPAGNLLRNKESVDIHLSLDLDGIDENNLPEDDFAGLDIPMDDLSTVFGW